VYLCARVRPAYEHAVGVDGLDEVADEGSLVAQHLPLGQLITGRHADHGIVQRLHTGHREHLHTHTHTQNI